MSNLQYKMFLLNGIDLASEFANHRFTIQNVPIKWMKLLWILGFQNHLQYKMFLLNKKLVEDKDFTEDNLQYKMFLLNP